MHFYLSFFFVFDCSLSPWEMWLPLFGVLISQFLVEGSKYLRCPRRDAHLSRSPRAKSSTQQGNKCWSRPSLRRNKIWLKFSLRCYWLAFPGNELWATLNKKENIFMTFQGPCQNPQASHSLASTSTLFSLKFLWLLAKTGVMLWIFFVFLKPWKPALCVFVIYCVIFKRIKEVKKRLG